MCAQFTQYSSTSDSTQITVKLSSSSSAADVSVNTLVDDDDDDVCDDVTVCVRCEYEHLFVLIIDVSSSHL